MSVQKIVFLSMFFLQFFSCNNDSDSDNTEREITSINTFGGNQNDSAQSVVSTTDGGYAVLGYTQSNNGTITDKTDTSFDYWVVKFNAQNNIEWQKTYGGTGDDRGQSIIQTTDGGYILIGTSNSTDNDVSINNGSQDFWIVKLDAQGNIIWEKSLGFSGNDNGISIIQTSDQGYLATGILDITASRGQGDTGRTTARHAGGEYWAVKLDTSGDLQWSKFFGGSFTDTPEGVVELNDGSFIIAGRSDSNDIDISSNKGSYDFWVIKISSTGNLIWEKSFGGQEIDASRAIAKTNDGNFVIAGDTQSNNDDVTNANGAADLWLIKISTDGNIIWEKTIGGTSFDVARDVKTTQDNGFILTGSSRSNDRDVSENKGQNDAWVVKVDNNGNLIWEISVGGSNIDFAYGVTELNDASIIAVGDTSSNDGDIEENKGFKDMLIININ